MEGSNWEVWSSVFRERVRRDEERSFRYLTLTIDTNAAGPAEILGSSVTRKAHAFDRSNRNIRQWGSGYEG